eukprot:CAMPEP_0119334352 /NCGR_PEP_ID=MMETSP1333-20130426/87113_1 /TAXON_ID=418940 /ORGANISM="Scyphosphaera apsteinii, Strain RCC1455" /LENGTH=37 /DNA_ID= /DNA_START= /DNA_END= /DNA_ORIENTATION=
MRAGDPVTMTERAVTVPRVLLTVTPELVETICSTLAL